MLYGVSFFFLIFFFKRLTNEFLSVIINTDSTDNTDKEVKILNGKSNVYENIIEEIKRLIDVGALRAGDKLPSVRSYALERKVNPNTVAKAYTALEENKVIEILPKKGAYVIGKEEKASVQSGLKKQILAIKGLGVAKSDLLSVIEEVYESEDRI